MSLPFIWVLYSLPSIDASIVLGSSPVPWNERWKPVRDTHSLGMSERIPMERVEVAQIGILVQHGVVLQAGVTLQVADKAVEIEEGFAVSQAPVQRGVEVDSAHAADDVGGFHGDGLRMLHGGKVVIVGVKTVDDGIDGGG